MIAARPSTLLIILLTISILPTESARSQQQRPNRTPKAGVETERQRQVDAAIVLWREFLSKFQQPS